MLTTKNLTPQQLSVVTALSLTMPVGIGAYILRPEWDVVIISSIIFFTGSYTLVLYTLQRFIYRKIKLIYKFIYQTKASRREETYYKYILPQKGIDEVREDVEKWASQQKAEIEILISNEAYRKEFLQNLAHEFKTPIFAIQGYVDTLLDGAMDNKDVSKRFLENAARNVNRLVTLASDLDEITKLESGEQPLYKVQFIIQDLIKEIYESLSIKTAEKNIKASIKKGCDQAVTVYA